MKLTVGSILVIVCGLMIIPAAFAHHGSAIYDNGKAVTVTGTVTEWTWSNPHCLLEFDVKDDKGHVDNWGVEMDPETNLARAGWKSTTVKPGDKVSIVVHPLRNDEKGGQYISITLADGSKLGQKPDGVL